ncbi:Alpha carbonic anhydrase 1, chloroplastic [Paramyrothecium foliicola]|nr:Alpha carbonic anhydrase 1, chloroplastic [Paramyrothecium foliicola]
MKSVLIASFVSMASAMCHYGTTLAPRGNLYARADGVTGYHELDGALNWHGLSPNNSLCAVGKNQSPINLDSKISTVAGSTFNFKVDSYPRGAELQNLGSTVQVHLNGSVIVKNKSYSLVQFHYHTPSEHHLLKEHYPLEVHFVFQAADAALAVIGFMIDVAIGAERTSPSLMASLAKLKDIPNRGDTVQTGALNFSDLISRINTSNVYSYDGSLTTPPCSEGVKFNVVADPVFVNVSTFRALKKLVKFNSRYTQNTPGQINLLENASNVLKQGTA